LTLIPSGGGAFEVTIDGNLVWSKKRTHDFPEYSTIAEAVSG
jgi:selT/selW/selH-like putative selenoprotein